jgi:hypothetical protein
MALPRESPGDSSRDPVESPVAVRRTHAIPAAEARPSGEPIRLVETDTAVEVVDSRLEEGLDVEEAVFSGEGSGVLECFGSSPADRDRQTHDYASTTVRVVRVSNPGFDPVMGTDRSLPCVEGLSRRCPIHDDARSLQQERASPTHPVVHSTGHAPFLPDPLLIAKGRNLTRLEEPPLRGP